MKFAFNFKKQEASLEADVEGLIKPHIDAKLNNPDRKTRYQIKQEEKRKNAERKHKQDMQKVFILIGLFVALLIFVFIMAALEG